MEILLTIFIRSVVAIVLMLFLTHFLGKHIISQQGIFNIEEVDNLLKHRLSTDWLELEIAKRGSNLSEISYGVMGTNGSLYFDFYHDHIE